MKQTYRYATGDRNLIFIMDNAAIYILLVSIYIKLQTKSWLIF